MLNTNVKDIVKWMQEQIKAQDQVLTIAEQDQAKHGGQFYKDRYTIELAKLEAMVLYKISTEKYMKKLKHEESVK